MAASDGIGSAICDVTCHAPDVTSHVEPGQRRARSAKIVDGKELTGRRFERRPAWIEVDAENEGTSGGRTRSTAAERQAKKREEDFLKKIVSISTKAPMKPGIGGLAKLLPTLVSSATLDALGETTLQAASGAMGQPIAAVSEQAKSPQGVQAVDRAAKDFIVKLIQDMDSVIGFLAREPDQGLELARALAYPGGPRNLLQKVEEAASQRPAAVKPRPAPVGPPLVPRAPTSPHTGLAPELEFIVGKLEGDPDAVRAITGLLATEGWQDRLVNSPNPATAPENPVPEDRLPDRLSDAAKRLLSSSRQARGIIKLVLQCDALQQEGAPPDDRWLALLRLSEQRSSFEVMRLAAGSEFDPAKLLRTPEVRQHLGPASDTFAKAIGGLIRHKAVRQLLEVTASHPRLAAHLHALVASLRQDRLDTVQEFSKLQHWPDPQPSLLVRVFSRFFRGRRG